MNGESERDGGQKRDFWRTIGGIEANVSILVAGQKGLSEQMSQLSQNQVSGENCMLGKEHEHRLVRLEESEEKRIPPAPSAPSVPTSSKAFVTGLAVGAGALAVLVVELIKWISSFLAKGTPSTG